MARILVVTGNVTSIVHANIAMARRLGADGHEVTYAGDANIREFVASQKLDFLSLDPPVKPEMVAQGNRLARWRQRWRSRPATWNEQQLDTRFGLSRFHSVLDEVNPDLILIEAEQHRFVMAAADRPLALTTTFLSPWRKSGAPPLHLDVAHGSDADAAWNRYLQRRNRRRRIDWISTAGHDPVSLHRELAKHCNFNWDEYTDFKQWQKPFFYKGIPTLNLNAAELDHNGAPPPYGHYVGAMINIDRFDEPDTRIDEFISTHAQRPLIYCASGLFRESYDLAGLQRLFEVARLKNDWSFIVVTGGSSIENPDALPGNVLACDRAPQLRCLKSASAAVIHGGTVSINECVATQTPMLMHSLGIRDQDGNAARARDCGLGLTGSREHDRASDIVAALERLIGEPSFARSLADMSARYQRYSDDRVLETTVRNLLK